jgi:hypothetical protein
MGGSGMMMIGLGFGFGSGALLPTRSAYATATPKIKNTRERTIPRGKFRLLGLRCSMALGLIQTPPVLQNSPSKKLRARDIINLIILEIAPNIYTLKDKKTRVGV